MRTLPRDGAWELAWGPGEGGQAPCLAPSWAEGQAFLLPGYRAVPLKNNYSEDLELASLLIKIEVFPAKVTTRKGAGEELGGSLMRLRSRTDPLCTALVEAGER